MSIPLRSPCTPEAQSYFRAYEYFNFVWYSDIYRKDARGEIPKDYLESMGDGGLYWVDWLSSGLFQKIDLKVTIIAISVFALFGLTYFFFPGATMNAIKGTYTFVSSRIPLTVLKTALFLSLIEITASHFARAIGRATNERLMRAFENGLLG